jgi:hypothetical protein
MNNPRRGNTAPFIGNIREPSPRTKRPHRHESTCFSRRGRSTSKHHRRTNPSPRTGGRQIPKSTCFSRRGRPPRQTSGRHEDPSTHLRLPIPWPVVQSQGDSPRHAGHNPGTRGRTEGQRSRTHQGGHGGRIRRLGLAGPPVPGVAGGSTTSCNGCAKTAANATERRRGLRYCPRPIPNSLSFIYTTLRHGQSFASRVPWAIARWDCKCVHLSSIAAWLSVEGSGRLWRTVVGEGIGGCVVVVKWEDPGGMWCPRPGFYSDGGLGQRLSTSSIMDAICVPASL